MKLNNKLFKKILLVLVLGLTSLCWADSELRITTYKITYLTGQVDTVNIVHTYEPVLSNDCKIYVPNGKGYYIVATEVYNFEQIKQPDTLTFKPPSYESYQFIK